MSANRLVFRLENKDSARIRVHQLEEALGHIAAILQAVEGELTGQRGVIAWEIADLEAGSAVLTLEPSAAIADPELPRRVGQAVTLGLQVLAQGASRPRYFNNRALESAAGLAKMLTDGLARIHLAFDGEQVDMALTIGDNVRGILEYVESFGSLDGILEVLEGREGKRPLFRIRDRIYNTRVRCAVPESMIRQALDAFRKRVLVSGLIKYDSSGQPQSVQVQGLELISEEDLPTAEDVYGILGDLGGLSPEEYLEQRYHGED